MQKPILLPFHFATGRGMLVVEAAQVQHAVDDAAHHLRLPACAKSSRLTEGLVHAHENFSV